MTVYYIPPVNEPLNVGALETILCDSVYLGSDKRGFSAVFSTSTSVDSTARNPRVDVSTSCISASLYNVTSYIIRLVTLCGHREKRNL